MAIIEQGQEESLAEYLLRNAAAFSLSVEQTARLRKAWVLQRGTKAEQTRSRVIAAGVNAEVTKRRRIEDRESARLEKMRGKESGAAPFNDSGAVRMKSQDGLANLFEAGKLTALEVEVALQYRAVLELEASDLRSGLDDTVRGGGDADAFRFYKAMACALRADIERGVILASRGDGARRGLRELNALRTIAGYGHCMERIAKGGAMRAIYLAALIRALGTAARVLEGRDPAVSAVTRHVERARACEPGQLVEGKGREVEAAAPPFAWPTLAEVAAALPPALARLRADRCATPLDDLTD